MNRTFKVFLILVTIFSSLIVLGSILGGFLAHAMTQDNSSGAIHSVTAINDDCFLIGCQLDKLIQLQEQENRLLAMQYCVQEEHYDDWCVPKALNDTK